MCFQEERNNCSYFANCEINHAQLISGGHLQLCLTFFMISQKVFITQKCFNYHLKADIKTFPTSGVALLYDHY